MHSPSPCHMKKAATFSSLSTDQLNYLNIGLMLVTACVALVRPFELFLLAYALLGPLHYLTEISWLHDRKYFTRGRHDYLVLVAFAGLITVIDMGLVPGLPAWLRVAATYIAFGSALVFVLFGSAWPRVLGFIALLATAGLVVRNDVCHSIFSVLLPTIVHVFVFTGLFILVGALKGRSVSGIASLAVFCLCSASFFVLGPAGSAGHVGEQVQRTYLVFAQLNYSLMTPFSQHDLTVPANVQNYVKYVNAVLYHSPTAMAVMGLIAFAYTYHYLNWFSKTSIIQWHNIPRSRFTVVIVIWLASIAAYLYDYRSGLRWLFFLSLTHVMLEFPLNHISIINVGKELRAIFSPQPRGSGQNRPKPV